MAKAKRKRTKKYNPTKNQNIIKDAMMKSKAARCVMYHWESAEYSDPEQQFIPVGQMDALLWACTRPTEWIVQVIALFIDENGDYYEEIADCLTSPCVLADGDIEEMIERVADQQKAAGNAKHYFDSVWIARVKTDSLLRKIENDEWVKGQALWRLNQIESDNESRIQQAA